MEHRGNNVRITSPDRSSGPLCPPVYRRVGHRLLLLNLYRFQFLHRLRKRNRPVCGRIVRSLRARSEPFRAEGDANFPQLGYSKISSCLRGTPQTKEKEVLDVYKILRVPRETV